jgi:hypothetical protein
MVGILTALPDTQLWKRLKNEGRLLGESSGENTNCELNFVPKMDPAQLIAGYKSIMRTIYGSREYYQRALASMRRTAHDFREPNPFGLLNGTAAFARIALKLGVIDRERREFWRFFAHTMMRHRDRLSESLRLAAMGYHFRKLSESYGEM